MVQNGSMQREQTAGQGQFDMLDNLCKHEFDLGLAHSTFWAPR